MAELKRFAGHRPWGSPLVLADTHPAVVEGRSLFTKAAGNSSSRVLVSGFNSRKIGKKVTKGKWARFPIYTLTLEERKTCPSTCIMWNGCFGNKMHWARRNQAGPTLEYKIHEELFVFQRIHPKGFVVRLHVLGDFYSMDYVRLWEKWLGEFPALNVFGYTARQLDDPIGAELARVVSEKWDRFAVRSSDDNLGDKVPHTLVVKSPEETDGIICPAQTDASDCCGTCSLCWQTTKPIIFLEH